MNKFLLGASVGTLGAALAASSAFAAGAAIDNSTVGEVIVTGTRATGVKAEDSAAPVQVVGSAVMSRTGATDLAGILQTAVPSLNIYTQGGDLAGLTVEAALRGLNPNDTLVLIDGKRRHTTSNLAVDSGSAYSGAATTDLAFIPEGAIDHVEVLTDGAAAQYGTDAIAGVVNIILKKSANAGQFVGTGGEYYDGQGPNGALSVNKGFALGDKGFVNVTLEDRYQDYTVNGCGDKHLTNAQCQALPGSNAAAYPGYPVINKVRGNPAFNIFNGMYNAGYDISDEIQLYSFASYGSRVARHYQNLRLANVVTGVTSLGVPVEPFPTGFDPQEKIKEQDYSWTGGVRGDVSGWHYDLSTTYGGDINDIYTIDSANASLFPVLQAQSPTPITPQRNFRDGSFSTTEWSNELDIDRNFEVGLASPLNVAFGVVGRRETYGITAGEPSSYYGSGAASFFGYTPLDAGNHSRTNYGVYADLAADLIKGWHVDVAGRYEHYSDFGATTIGKLTTRYDFNPMFAVRGTVSTGFRAPTLAEENYSGTNVNVSAIEAQLPPNSAAALVAGFPPLKPETSTNYSVGFVLHPVNRLQITADAYEIDIKNRILVSGQIYGTVSGALVSQRVQDAISNKLGGGAVPAATSYTAIAVFANAASTRTKGVEVTASYASDFGDVGHVDWSVGFNYNETTITDLLPLPAGDANAAFGQTSFLGKSGITALTTAPPKEKAVLQAFWHKDRFSVNLRETVYGPAAQFASNFASQEERMGATGITDLDIGFKLTERIKLDIGANNLFNVFPPHATNRAAECACHVFNPPFTFSPFGTNGGSYYGRVTASF